jgi:hypothetical protein
MGTLRKTPKLLAQRFLKLDAISTVIRLNTLLEKNKIKANLQTCRAERSNLYGD